MKPVNLLPGDAPVVKAAAGKPNLGMIGGAAAGFIAVIGVAGYFAMARVDSVKSETTQAEARAAAALQQASATEAEVQSLGQPVVDSDRQLAQGAEAVLVSAYTERHDFVLLASELRGIKDPAGWYESIEASAGPAVEGKAVTIVGYMPTKELAASFDERAEGTRSLANAEAIAISSETLTDLDSRRPGKYYKFTVTADLVDTVAPKADGSGAPVAGGDATIVGDGASTGELSLSLEPKPKPKAKAAGPAAEAVPAKPKNPFDVAAAAARGGGA